MNGNRLLPFYLKYLFAITRCVNIWLAGHQKNESKKAKKKCSTILHRKVITSFRRRRERGLCCGLFITQI